MRIWQANIGKTILAHVPVADGAVVESGDFELDGVTFPAAEIVLEFLDPSDDGEGEGGALFPTGNLVDALEVPGVGTLQATMITAGIPTVFVHANDLGLAGTELQPAINTDRDLLDKLEAIRVAGALAMGLIKTPEEAATRQHTPKIAWVAPPVDYVSSAGKAIAAADIDLNVRAMSMGKLHHAMMGTASVAIATAAAIPGTLVNLAAGGGQRDAVRFGHPSGTLRVGASADCIDGQWQVTRAVMSRSARILMKVLCACRQGRSEPLMGASHRVRHTPCRQVLWRQVCCTHCPDGKRSPIMSGRPVRPDFLPGNPMSTVASPTHSRWLLPALALLSAVAPLATDMYLPSLPQMAAELGSTAAGVQLTLTAFLAGLGCGQFVIGPLSDALGRRRPLLAGTVLCLLGSVLCALSDRLELLVAARFLQGFAGAAGVVLARAIIADISTGAEIARRMSLMMVIGGVAPVLAPTLGGLVAEHAGWRAVLWVLVGLVALMCLGVLIVVRETLPPASRRSGGLRSLLANGRQVLQRRRYVG